MTVSDEEFARQLWAWQWSHTMGIEESNVTWDRVSLQARDYYIRGVNYIKNSAWFDGYIEQAMDRGFEQGRAE